MTTDATPFFVKLPDRGLIHIEGKDRHDFLQNLISNDMDLLEQQPNLYACLLTPQGKFLHDFFVIKGDGFYLLDCEGDDRAQDLYKRLSLYRLRAKVQISVEEKNNVYAVLNNSKNPTLQKSNHLLSDPRHPDLGFRSFEKPEDGIEEKPFANWDRRRIRLAIPDGSRDMVVEKDTLLDCNIDKCHGVSFDKGCYIGQEITARMHHRGLVKKHLYSIQLQTPSTPPPSSRRKPGSSSHISQDPGFRRDDSMDTNFPAPFSDIHIDGTLAGQMRSSCGDLGLAMIKDTQIDLFTAEPFKIVQK